MPVNLQECCKLMGFIKNLKSLFSTESEIAQVSSSAVSSAAKDNESTSINLDWPEKNSELYEQLEDTYYQYFIGVNSLLNLELNTFEIDVIRSLNTTLKNPHSLADEIPRLPDVVPKLIHLLKTNTFSWKEVADLIATDPVILVGVIKVANSSFYNLNVNNEQLESVLVKIGASEVRELIIKVALKPIMLFEGGHFLKHSGTKIWIHAVKSAVASRTLAKLYKQDPFDAYLAGLLSNLGMTIVVQKMNEIKEFKNAPRSLQFRDKLLKISKKLSLQIAESWEINSNVCEALADQMLMNVNNSSPLGKILYQASAVSMQHILMGENRWVVSKHVSQEEDELPFEKAYQALETLVLD